MSTKQNIRELYKTYKNKNKEIKHEKKKCKARMRNCDCGYHFKKGEEECLDCKQKKRTCKNWVLPGKEVCRIHGGKGGRPMTRGVVLKESSFTKKEWDEIKKGIEEDRDWSDFVYQTAGVAYKKIVDNINPNVPEDVILLLKAACEFYNKIIKSHKDLATQQKLPVNHCLEPLIKQQINKDTNEYVHSLLKGCVESILTITSQEINDKVIYKRIFERVPECYKDYIKDSDLLTGRK